MNTALVSLGTYNETVIDCRPSDEFVNATAMCQATGKRWTDYWRNENTQQFMAALARNTSSEISHLIQSSQIRGDLGGGTWVHRRVAIHLAQWCSPDFAVWVSGQIEAVMTGRQVAHREQAEAVIVNIQNDISVLHSKFETLVSKMLLIQEQNQTIMSQMLPILKRIDERTQGKREGFSSEVKKKFVSCVSTLYSGKCPCCHRVDIAKNGKPIPYAGEHDHYHHRSMNRIEHGWFVCKSCNNKLKNRKPDGFWFLAGPAFQQFQRLIHEGDGPQMFLTFDSADPNELTLFQSPKPKV